MYICLRNYQGIELTEISPLYSWIEHISRHLQKWNFLTQIDSVKYPRIIIHTKIYLCRDTIIAWQAATYIGEIWGPKLDLCSHKKITFAKYISYYLQIKLTHQMLYWTPWQMLKKIWMSTFSRWSCNIFRCTYYLGFPSGCSTVKTAQLNQKFGSDLCNPRSVIIPYWPPSHQLWVELGKKGSLYFPCWTWLGIFTWENTPEFHYYQWKHFFKN